MRTLKLIIAIFPAPSLVLEIVLGERSDELFSSLKVTPKILKETGCDFAYPDLNSGFRLPLKTIST